MTLSGIRTIADRSAVAFAGSGRAEITFDVQPRSHGTTELSFSGQNLEMVIHFAGEDTDRPAFDAQNRTVDGEFYLLDGPVGAKQWIHDTNSSGARGSDLFDTDPRALVATLAPGARFATAGHGEIDGVAVTHLRATEVGALPSLKLGLGPIDGRSISALDLWVGDDDVVRRMDLTTETKTDVVDPAVAPTLTKDPAAGTVTAVFPDGRRVEITAEGKLAYDELLQGLPHTTRVDRSTFSVRFFDLGAPIDIVAPPDPVDVAAVG